MNFTIQELKNVCSELFPKLYSVNKEGKLKPLTAVEDKVRIEVLRQTGCAEIKDVRKLLDLYDALELSEARTRIEHLLLGTLEAYLAPTPVIPAPVPVTPENAPWNPLPPVTCCVNKKCTKLTEEAN